MSLRVRIIVGILGVLMQLAIVQIYGDCFPADVALVLDDSESIRIYDAATDAFTFAVDYSSVVRDLLALLDPITVRVSLVTYSQTAVGLVGLTSDYSLIIDEVDTYTREYSSQRTDLGIDVAIDELSRARVEVTKYMIVFLDGTSVDPDRTMASVIRAGDNGIIIIAVSLRGPIEESYIIAGRSYRRFSVATPGELASRPDIIQGIADIICFECKGYSDIVYLLDGSDSTRRVSSDFSRIFYAPGVIDFVVNVTEKVAIGPIRKGIIMYSSTAQEVIAITGNRTDVINAVRNAQPQYSNTLAGVAFKEAQRMFDDAVPQTPFDTMKIVVYMVDGTVTNKSDLTIEAKAVRDSGTIVFAAGFAPAALQADLLLAAGSLDTVYRIPSDLDLAKFVDPFVDFLCQTPPSLTANTASSS